MARDLIGSREAAEILNRPQTTVNRWAGEGRLRVVAKLPGLRGAYLFRRKDVEALLPQLAKEAS